MHHYTICGLDNVFLSNGYRVRTTSQGRGISIDDIDGLHRAIGKWLIAQPKPIGGAELRFLRVEMDLSQKRLAALIGSTEQNVLRWERACRRAMPGPADRLIRALYNEYIGGDGTVRRLVDRLAELDQVLPTRVHLRETENGWKVEDLAQLAQNRGSDLGKSMG